MPAAVKHGHLWTCDRQTIIIFFIQFVYPHEHFGRGV